LFAKAVTSGYMPLGGVVASGRVAEPFWRDADAPVFRHGYTYSGHATACAAGIANLQLLDSEALPDRARGLEPAFAEIVGSLRSAPAVSDVRVVALAAAVQLDPAVVETDPSFPRNRLMAARHHGGLEPHPHRARLPGLAATLDELERIANGLEAGLRDAAGSPGLARAGIKHLSRVIVDPVPVERAACRKLASWTRPWPRVSLYP
jgi:putrescine---pyruvate transaminase